MTTKTEVDEIGQAEREAADADQLVAALEERVREGDESVTPEQIAAQRELGKFARLRAEGARRKAEKARRAVREQAMAELADEMRAAGRDEEQLVAAIDTFESALRALGEAVAGHNQRVVEWRKRMQALDIPHDGHGGPEHAGLAWNERGHHVSVDGQTVRRLSTGRLVGITVHRVAHEWWRADQRGARYGTEYGGRPLAVRVPDQSGAYGVKIDPRGLVRRGA
ncbi:hypothetical protein ACWDA3_55560 [Nonomuraea rubra]